MGGGHRAFPCVNPQLGLALTYSLCLLGSPMLGSLLVSWEGLHCGSWVQPVCVSMKEQPPPPWSSLVLYWAQKGSKCVENVREGPSCGSMGPEAQRGQVLSNCPSAPSLPCCDELCCISLHLVPGLCQDGHLPS
jgi:hypothetical protein